MPTATTGAKRTATKRAGSKRTATKRPATKRTGTKRTGTKRVGTKQPGTKRTSPRRPSSSQARRRQRTRRRQQFAQQIRRFNALAPIRELLPSGPVILRPSLPGATGFHPSKLLSLALLTAVVAMLVWFQSNESFFVYPENVRFRGNSYLPVQELYEQCNVDSWSILWLDPEQIRQDILEHPYVTDAQVSIRWPARVTVTITEAQPAALWVTDQGEFWVLEDGRALPQRAVLEQPPVRIIDGPGLIQLETGDGSRQVNRGLVEVARSLAQRLPGLTELQYSPSQGLSFGLPGSKAWVYWGNERRFEEKWQALTALRTQLAANPEETLLLNVVAPDRPTLRRVSAPPQQP